MLRRRLVANLGLLVMLLLLAAIAAIWLLQGVLRDLDHVQGWNHNVNTAELQQLTARFRWLVLGLTATFIVLINVSVMMLLRMSWLIVKPMDKLVEATRHLEQERFDHRIQLESRDEFGELACAYNAMAERLQTNERQRLETLTQAAIALNHELNNSIAIIELQLAMLSRQSGTSASPEKLLRQIHESLQRMTQTVQLLKNVRRIVLTDYTPGTKMLDLERSTAEQQPVEV